MNVNDVIALSCAVYRHNNNQYIKNDSYDEESKTWTKSNKRLMREELSELTIKKIPITDDDRNLAEKITNHFTKLSFKVLDESINSFSRKVYELTQATDYWKSDIGIFAILPKVYFDDLKRQENKKVINQTSGEYLGLEGQSLQVKCKLLEVRYVEPLECFSHTAISESQALVSWLHKKQAGYVNDWIQIKGRVKEHGKHWIFKKPETKLNYVKYF